MKAFTITVLVLCLAAPILSQPAPAEVDLSAEGKRFTALVGETAVRSFGTLYLDTEPSTEPSAFAFSLAFSPARPVPPARWGALEPVLYTNCAQLKLSAPCMMGDATNVSPLSEPGITPFYHDVAVSGTDVFAATGQGIRIFDVSNPAAPRPFFVNAKAEVHGNGGLWTFSDKNFFLTSIAASSSNLIVTGNEEFGFIAWNTINKGSVSFRYQDSEAFIVDVYTGAVDGRRFAAALDNRATVHWYNLDAIAGMTHCYQQTAACPGAKMGSTAQGQGSGGSISGTGPYVVRRDNREVTILLAGTLPSPPPTKLVGTLPSDIFYAGEVAMWEAAGKFYLAVAAGGPWGGKTFVYDVSCITGAGACGLPAPLATYDTTDPAGAPSLLNLDISRHEDGRWILFVGTALLAGDDCVENREKVFDSSNPAAMVDLTPPRVAPPGPPDPDQGGFWGWYSEACEGFNRIGANRHGVMLGSQLYLAGYPIFHSVTVGSGDQPIPPPTDPGPEPCEVPTGLICFDGFENPVLCSPVGQIRLDIDLSIVYTRAMKLQKLYTTAYSKTNLGKLMQEAQEAKDGETIVVTKHGVPAVVLVPVAEHARLIEAYRQSESSS